MPEQTIELEAILERASELDIKYVKDRQSLSNEAYDLLMDNGAGITTNRELFLLAIHGLSPYINANSGEQEIVENYRKVSEFAHASVNAALAEISEDHSSYPRTSYISELMYVPNVLSPRNNRSKLRYRARQTNDPGTRGGWVELGVAGHKIYSPNSSKARTDLSGESYRALAYARSWVGSSGDFEDYTSNFTVGFQAIYDRRPSIVDINHRKAEQIFTAIIDSAIKEYPDGIR